MLKAFSNYYRYSSITEKGSTLIALKHYNSSSIFHITMQLKQTINKTSQHLYAMQVSAQNQHQYININICTMNAYSKKI